VQYRYRICPREIQLSKSHVVIQFQKNVRTPATCQPSRTTDFKRKLLQSVSLDQETLNSSSVVVQNIKGREPAPLLISTVLEETNNYSSYSDSKEIPHFIGVLHALLCMSKVHCMGPSMFVGLSHPSYTNTVPCNYCMFMVAAAIQIRYPHKQVVCHKTRSVKNRCHHRETCCLVTFQVLTVV
jgi:hypothetical protein